MFTNVYSKLLSNFWEPRNFRSLKLLIAAGYLAANRFNFLWNSTRADYRGGTSSACQKKLLMAKYAGIRKVCWYLNLIYFCCDKEL